MNVDQLKKFCAPPGSVHQIFTKPHTIDGVTFATDTAIAIRIPAIPDGKSVDEYPDYKKIINSVAKKSKKLKSIEIPDFAILEMKKCLDCYGSGLSTKDEIWCQNCEGAGKIEGLIGMENEIKPVLVGDTYFNPYLLSLIYKLPGIKIFPDGKKFPAYFIFYGGDGVIMPYRV
jgi:hypothetical protein